MIFEMHIIQNFAPSNLNRDDSNTPKDCDFGGCRRARISSQCIKRSVRRHPVFIEAVKKAGGNIGIRTKRIKKRLEEMFTRTYNKSPDESAKVAVAVIELLGLKLSDTEKTEYLLYLGENEVAEIANIAVADWEALQKKESGKGKKEKGAVPANMKKIQANLSEVVAKSRKEAKSYAADIALFGRMIADNKNMSVDATCKVAHAISTHKVDMEMDYFTAVDDLLSEEDSGSDMIGTVEFNSSCFYRYSLIDIEKLKGNLGFNDDLLEAVILAYLDSSVKAIPTGKQNSMAAQNPPGYLRVVMRNNSFPCSMANAFQKPIDASRDKSIEELSIEALNDYYDRLGKIYGKDSITCDTCFNIYDPQSLSFDEVLKKVSETLSQGVRS